MGSTKVKEKFGLDLFLLNKIEITNKAKKTLLIPNFKGILTNNKTKGKKEMFVLLSLRRLLHTFFKKL